MYKTHCVIYKTHCVIYKTHCVMKNLARKKTFPTKTLRVLEWGVENKGARIF